MAAGRGAAARLLMALGTALLLAACDAGGPLKAPWGDAAGETITGSDGQRLALSEWQAEAPEAVILAVHGYGDYGPSTYRDAAKFWAGHGITTYAYDQRGFGRNPSRGYWPGADALVADLNTVAAQIRERHPCQPLVVVGHSMGGGVTLAAAGSGLRADGLVLAAPAIWGGQQMNPLHRLVAWLAAVVAPEKRYTGKGVVSIQASDNIEALNELGRDPLYLSPPSAREFMGLVRVTDLAERAAAKVKTPALLLLGRKDQIVPNDTVETIFRRLDGPRQIRFYPDGWHLLFRDLHAEQVWQDVADWAKAAPRAAPTFCPAGAE